MGHICFHHCASKSLFTCQEVKVLKKSYKVEKEIGEKVNSKLPPPKKIVSKLNRIELLFQNYKLQNKYLLV